MAGTPRRLSNKLVSGLSLGPWSQHNLRCLAGLSRSPALSWDSPSDVQTLQLLLLDAFFIRDPRKERRLKSKAGGCSHPYKHLEMLCWLPQYPYPTQLGDSDETTPGWSPAISLIGMQPACWPMRSKGIIEFSERRFWTHDSAPFPLISSLEAP